MKKLLLSTAMVLGLIAPAFAQVNFVPQVGVNSANLRGKTYTAAIKNLVPEATAGTDFFCISGAAGKAIAINRIELWGTGTAATQVVFLNHNLGLDTGTTAVKATFGPVANPLNSNNPAAAATVVAYNSTSGNPSIGGTVTLVRSGQFSVVAATVGAAVPGPLVWIFGTGDELYNQRLDIPSGATTEQYCLNWAGATVTASVVQGYIEWTEQ